MTPKPTTHCPVPHHCLGPSRASALGHGTKAAPTSSGAYRRMTSPLIYAIAIPVAFLRPWMAGALYVVGAVMWLVPDRRIERTTSHARREISTVGEA